MAITTEEKVQRLENLLERVRRKAAVPRVAAAVVLAEPAAASAEEPPTEAVADDDWASAEPPVAESAPPVIEAAPADDEELEEMDLELLEDDIVEIMVDDEAAEGAPAEPEPLAAAEPDAVDIDFEDEDEDETPASSRRPKVAAESMDEALASAAAQLEMDSEPPLHTPPPESGQQVAGPPAAQLEAPPVPVDMQVGEPEEFVPAASAPGPTPEQLGATIELPEPAGPALELDAPVEAKPKVARADELEAPLPVSEAPGAYDEALIPPPEARQELQRHVERTGPAAPAAAAPAAVAPSAGGPEIVQRPPAPGGVIPATFAGDAQSFQPRTFAELLDATLKL